MRCSCQRCRSCSSCLAGADDDVDATLGRRCEQRNKSVAAAPPQAAGQGAATGRVASVTAGFMCAPDKARRPGCADEAVRPRAVRAASGQLPTALTGRPRPRTCQTLHVLPQGSLRAKWDRTRVAVHTGCPLAESL